MLGPLDTRPTVIAAAKCSGRRITLVLELYNEFRSRKVIGADKEVAQLIGLKPAIVLNRIIWSCGTKKEHDREKYFIDGHWWMAESIASFAENLTLGESQVKLALRKVISQGLVESRRQPKATAEKPKMYRPIAENIRKLLTPAGEVKTADRLVQNDQPVSSKQPTGQVKMTNRIVQNDQPVSSKQPTGWAKTANHSLFTYSPLIVSLESSNSLLKKQNARASTQQQHDTTDAEGTACMFPDDETVLDISQEPKNTPPAAEKGVGNSDIPKPKKTQKKTPTAPRAKTLKYSSNHLRLGKVWLERSVQRTTRAHKSWTPENFADHIAKAQRSTKVSDEVLERVVEFATTDYFWSKNCLSPTCLLKRNSQGDLRMDQLLNAMITKTDMVMHNLKNHEPLVDRYDKESIEKMRKANAGNVNRCRNPIAKEEKKSEPCSKEKAPEKGEVQKKSNLFVKKWKKEFS